MDKYKLKSKCFGFPDYHKIFDLHTLAQIIYYLKNNNFFMKEDHSDMGLTNTLEFCGMKDNRKAHNALEDAKLTAECFSRLVYGKSLFLEYAQFKISMELKKNETTSHRKSSYAY